MTGALIIEKRVDILLEKIKREKHHAINGQILFVVVCVLGHLKC